MKKFNYRLAAVIWASLVDEAILLVLILWVLPLFGIKLPLVAIILLAGIFFGLGVLIYFFMSKKPTLGFESQIGVKGIAVTRIDRKGTVKIGRELWAVRSAGSTIDAGTSIVVVGQSFLILTVRPESPSLVV